MGRFINSREIFVWKVISRNKKVLSKIGLTIRGWVEVCTCVSNHSKIKDDVWSSIFSVEILRQYIGTIEKTYIVRGGWGIIGKSSVVFGQHRIKTNRTNTGI